MLDPQTEILATVMPSAIRRGAGLMMLCILGGLLVYVAIVTPPASMFWQAFLLGLGAVVLWLAENMRRATKHGVVLTADELRTTDGQLLVRVEDMTGVVRGTFALKPSNGFSVLTKTNQTRAWAPGLWWRIGKRVGVGGVTAASQSKFMSEVLAQMLAERGIER
ncbi:hypothetical protein JI58_05705 [Marinosulfonomonas sp. PRT-SC04]|nr:hypothetical protein JI58_05705 [Marinosulfonomonas sp. PRT-SC04]